MVFVVHRAHSCHERASELLNTLIDILHCGHVEGYNFEVQCLCISTNVCFLYHIISSPAQEGQNMLVLEKNDFLHVYELGRLGEGNFLRLVA